ncbi:MAG: menaquinone biosynthesis protein [Bacteroidota bacterium]
MHPLKISAISYLNTVPFVYGIQNYPGFSDYEIEFDVPSSCAEKLIHNKTDVGIVPVATIPFIPDAQIITPYCIGALKAVETVVLASRKPLSDIRIVYLDTDSRTSVLLLKVLAKHHWKLNFEFLPLGKKQWAEFENHEAAVLIGDKTFGLKNHFALITDLATQWYQFINLPFVFACWVANKKLPEPVLQQFSNALSFGLKHVDEAVKSVDVSRYPGVNIHRYLTKTISYTLDEEKRQGMRLFLEMSKDIR